MNKSNMPRPAEHSDIGKSTSPIFSEKSKIKKRRTNWHEAAVCAIQIELRDYVDLLDFQPEYALGKNNYRIDLLVIKTIPES